MSLAEFIKSANQDRFSAIALSKGLDGPSLTYAQLFSQVERVAPFFTKGEIISVCLDNSIEHAVLFLAIGAAGAIIAPLNPGYTETEFEFYLKRSPRGVIVPQNGGNPNAEKAANRLGVPIFRTLIDGSGSITLSGKQKTHEKNRTEVIAENTCLILFTSGTTGEPKAVPLSHGNLIASISNISETYKLKQTDKTICVMPLFHIHGLMASLNSTLLTGGTVVFPSTGKFSASNFMQELLGNACTWFSAVPTMLQIILNSASNPIPPHKLRFIRSCSAALAPSLLDKIEKRFSVHVLEAYAMTEASHQMTSNPLDGRRRPGSVGIPHGNVQIRIYSPQGKMLESGTKGEVCVKGPSVIKGYLNNPSANATAFFDGFFRTGDEGFVSLDDGFLTITGRLKELINKGGEKISPIEVDSVVLTHPAVSEAVSFAIPDLKYGETVGVAVVLKSGQKITESQLAKYIGTKIASFKVPSKIFIAATLPKTATGKIQRRIVAQKFVAKSNL
jgi:acyl-CoA synthetase (AMP-forming)/AMP-acid ligase II